MEPTKAHKEPFSCLTKMTKLTHHCFHVCFCPRPFVVLVVWGEKMHMSVSHYCARRNELATQIHVPCNTYACPPPFVGKRMVEVGCGRGGGAYYVASSRKPLRYSALDFSPQNLKLARARFSNVQCLEFKESNAMDLPFDANRYEWCAGLLCTILHESLVATLFTIVPLEYRGLRRYFFFFRGGGGSSSDFA